MSQHHCDTRQRMRGVRVALGFDPMLSRLFMDVVPLDREGRPQPDRPLYSSGGDPHSQAGDIEFFKKKLDDLQIAIPDAMIQAVLKDRVEQVGNYIVLWKADGTSTVLVPKEGSHVDVPSEEMRYGIWCMRLGGRAGPAQAWLKADGKRVTFESFEAASQEAARIQSEMKSPNLRYEAREILPHLR